MIRYLALSLLFAYSLNAESLFDADGVFASVQAVDTIDLEATRLVPDESEFRPGVLRLQQAGHHYFWGAEEQAEPTTFHYVLTYREPQMIGTVLFIGNFRVSYLKQGADNDPLNDASWQAVPYPGEAHRQVRMVPLPPGTTTRAIRLSGAGTATMAGTYSQGLALFTTLRERLVNVAPEARLAVSSSNVGSTGFRPDLRSTDPQVLLDGSFQNQNWMSGPRESDISDASPEWMLLDWGEPREMRGLALLIGGQQSGAGHVLVQQFTGRGAPSDAEDTAWETIAELQPRRPFRPPLVWESTVDFGRTIRTRALRLVATSGLSEAQSARGERANLRQIGLGEILVVQQLGDAPAPEIRRPAAQPDGVVPITFTMPHDGKASIRIVDGDGRVVRNLVNGETFSAGEQTVWWDLTTIDDFWPPFEVNGYNPPADTERMALPGGYRWEGIHHPGLSLEYLYSYYPLKEHGLAWITADRTGGWLADHAPPQTLARVGDRVWAGTFVEAGHAILEADLQMRKLWGSGRIWLACPRVMATANDKLYYLEQGGWARKLVMIEVDPQTKQSRRLLGRDIEEDEALDIQGLAVVGTRAFIANRAADRVLIVDMADNLAADSAAGFSWKMAWDLQDHESMNVMQTLDVPRPGRIRPYDAEHLAIVSNTTVQLLNLESLELRPLITGLTNPLGLAVDSDGNLYVGEMEPLHQVKVFSPDGELLRTIGKEGPHILGTFDRNNLESPAGVEVDANGNVWVAEFNYALKRTSVWGPEGDCLHQVLGPTVYGGGGDIDPRDANRFWYHGKEFRRDPQSGDIRLERLVWRPDLDDVDRFFSNASPNFDGKVPAYPFYHDDQLFFTSWQGWAAGATTTIWRYSPQGLLRPVGAIGTPPVWLGERFPQWKQATVFAWTDRNGDGRVQESEAEADIIQYDGKPWKQVGAQWQFRMNGDFVAAVTDGSYNAAGVAWFKPRDFTPEGYPIYALPTELTLLPRPDLGHAVDAVYTDRQGNAIQLDNFLVSMAPDGTVNWRYKNRWPGLHRGHHTTATGEEPGVLIAPTRFFGGAWVNDHVGEIFCVNSNLGSTHLFTADGYYIDRAFQDVRVGLSWQMNTPPTPELLSQLSLNDEHFGGTFQKVQTADGGDSYRYVVGKTHSSVVELHGLEEVRRFEGGELTVTGEHLSAAEALLRNRELASNPRPTYTIPYREGITVDGKSDDWPEERIHGFALAWDRSHLYLWYNGQDTRAPFRNATTDNFLEAFKHGDVVDLKLQTRPDIDPSRKEAGEGDIRLSLTEVNGEPAAILYDYRVPGTPDNARLPFSSPWRTIYIDRVQMVPEAKIAVDRQARAFSLEAAIPLAALGLDPATLGTTRGDVGRLRSDQTGTRTVARDYWSNRSTAIMSDVPSEAMLQPALWGDLIFAPAP